MQYFIVIGGGIEQQPMYISLRKRGIKIIGVDINKNCSSKKYCDFFIKESTREPKKILAALKKINRKIIGVSTLGTDTPYTVSKIASVYKLNSITINSALNVSLKDRMKKCFTKNKINTPKYFICSSFKNLKKNINKINYPIIIKPIDGRGSEGVFYIENSNNLEKYYKEVRNKTKLKKIILEQYLPGKQFSAEGFFEKGKFFLSGVALRYYDNLKYTKPNIIEAGGFLPAQISNNKMLNIEKLMQNTGISLGIKSGPLKSDLVYYQNKFYVIEVAGRLSGNYLASHYIKWIHKINLVNLTINFALGQSNKTKNLLRKNLNKFISIRYLFPRVGIIKKVEFPKNIKKYKTFHDKKIFFKKKIEIKEHLTHRDRIGLIRCIGNDSKRVKKDIKNILRKISFKYERE